MTRLFCARYLLPIDCPPLEDGALLVSEGRVREVGPRRELEKRCPQAEVVDCADGIILPPLVNAHTHLELTRYPRWREELPPAAAPDDFVGWVEQLIEIKRRQDEGELRRSLSEGLQLSLRCGTGAVGDILSQPRLISAYAGSPLYGRIYHEVLGVEPAYVEPRLASIEQLLEDSPGRLGHGLSPHSPYTLSREMLERVLNFSDLKALPLSIHLAESPAESTFFSSGDGPIIRRLYPYVGWQDRHPRPLHRSPVAYFCQMHGLGPQTLAVHGVQVDEKDVGILASAGTTVVLCPRSNERLGVGLPPVGLYRRAGVTLALGTDSLASNDSLSIWDELTFAHARFADLVPPAELLRWATRNGARALGLSGELGCLRQGCGASFQVVTLPQPPSPEELEEALCAAGGDIRVRQLFLDGEQVLPET